MRSPKTFAILLLAATTLGGAILAWRQYGELVELRAAAMNRDERSDLQRRLWDLEKQNRDLQAQLAVRRGSADIDGLIASANEGERPPRERGGRGERGGEGRGGRPDGMQQANAIRDLMNKPEVQAMLNFQQKAAIDQRYAALFKNLNLSSEQTEKLKTLLAERTTTMQDVMSAARDQDINPRENPDAFRKLISDAQNEINNSIKSVIGEQGFAQLTNYEQTLPQRNLVNELQQRLSYTSNPLTSAQAEQLVQILASNAPPRTTSSTSSPASSSEPQRPPGGLGGPGDFVMRGPDFGGMIAGVLGGGPGMGMMVSAFDGGRGGTASVTQAAVTQSQTVLAPPQVEALQQIQQQQQTQQQLRKLVSDTLSTAQPAGATKSAPPPPRPRGGG